MTHLFWLYRKNWYLETSQEEMQKMRMPRLVRHTPNHLHMGHAGSLVLQKSFEPLILPTSPRKVAHRNIKECPGPRGQKNGVLRCGMATRSVFLCTYSANTCLHNLVSIQKSSRVWIFDIRGSLHQKCAAAIASHVNAPCGIKPV